MGDSHQISPRLRGQFAAGWLSPDWKFGGRLSGLSRPLSQTLQVGPRQPRLLLGSTLPLDPSRRSLSEFRSGFVVNRKTGIRAR